MLRLVQIWAGKKEGQGREARGKGMWYVTGPRGQAQPLFLLFLVVV